MGILSEEKEESENGRRKMGKRKRKTNQLHITAKATDDAVQVVQLERLDYKLITAEENNNSVGHTQFMMPMANTVE